METKPQNTKNLSIFGRVKKYFTDRGINNFKTFWHFLGPFRKMKVIITYCFLDHIGPLFYTRKSKNIKTTLVLLGPYRNLTTLTVSIFSLHPSCEVLNHAAKRTLSREHLNFFNNYSDKKFNNFNRFALYASHGGTMGAFGGGIYHSHAFQHKIMKELYFKNKKKKKKIECIVWKEPLRVAKFIKKNNVDLDIILKAQKGLKFIMPIRNPLDCAVSSLRTGHYKLFNEKIKTAEELLEYLIKEYRWFLDLKTKHPDRFIYFFQHGFNKEFLVDVAKFSGLNYDEDWIKDSLSCYNIKKSYDHSEKLVDKYKKLVNKYFKNNPSFKKDLLRFVAK